MIETIAHASARNVRNGENLLWKRSWTKEEMEAVGVSVPDPAVAGA